MEFFSQTPGVPGVIAVGEQPIGIIAIGGAPIGVIAIGGFGCGIVSFGLFSFGILAIGGVVMGLFSYSVGVAFGGSVKVTGVGFGAKLRGVGSGFGLNVDMVGADEADRLGPYGTPSWWAKSIAFAFCLAALLWAAAHRFGMFDLDFLGDYYFGMISLISASIVVGTPWILKRSGDSQAAALAAAREAKRRRSAMSVAVIESLERTGLLVNDQPEIRFELKADLGTHVWTGALKRITDIIEVPRLQPGVAIRVHYDPDDLENLHFDFNTIVEESSRGERGGKKEEPMTSDDASLQAGQLLLPTWLLGWDDPEDWLFTPRSPTRPLVALVQMHDPHRAEANDAQRNAIVEAASLMLSEHLWAKTDLRSDPVIFFEVGGPQRRIHVGPKLSYDDLLPALGDFDSMPIAIWGEAEEDLESEGFTLRIRAPGAKTTRTIGGPLNVVAEELVETLVRDGHGARVQPPYWFASVDDYTLPVYGTVLDQHMIQRCANRGALPALKDTMHWESVSSAIDLLEMESAPPQSPLLFASAVLEAHRAGFLRPEQKMYACGVVEDSTSGDPLRQLAPHFFAELGDLDKAKEWRDRLLAEYEGSGAPFRGRASPYLEWLRGLKIPN